MTEKIFISEFVADLVRRLAEQHPDKLGLVFEGKGYTFAEMDKRADKAANAMSALGLKKGDRLAWLAQNVGTFWDVLFGAARVGVVLTPINWRLAPAEIAQIFEDSGAPVLVAERQFLNALSDIENFDAERVIPLDDPDQEDFEALISKAADDTPDLTQVLDDPFVQLYTSGTTGLPKGVVISHRAFYETSKSGRDMNLLAALTPDERALHVLPHFHIAGLNYGILAMQRHMTIMQYRQFDPVAIVEGAQEGYPINTFLVPAMLMMILEAAKKTGKPLTNFVNVSYGAAPMPEPLLNALMAMIPDAQFTQLYGATETNGGVTALASHDHGEGLPQRRSAGKPLLGSQLKICDPATGEEKPTGKVGEVVIKAPWLMSEYWKKPDATDAAKKDGWYWSGDAGYLDENGYLFIVDRIKDMIISGGENIYPAEIENILVKHEAVLEVAVIGLPDERWGEVVKAVIACRPGATLCSDDILAYLDGKIAKFKLPRSVEFIEALPRNPSGKILKTALRQRADG